MKIYEVAVLGLGTMGSFTCRELAVRKASVLGLDQFAPPHDRGSHSGDTRIFRIAYAEHPDYAPLAQRSGVLWDRFGEERGAPLLTHSGMLSMGTPDSDMISGIRLSARLHKLPIQELSADMIRSAYPAFELPEDHVGLFEPAAGWIDAGASIRFALQAAQRAGADVRFDAPVTAWEQQGSEFQVHTAKESFTAAKLVITAGAWAGELLRDLSLPLAVVRKVMVWLDPLRPEYFQPDRLPVFAFSDRFFYGFPNIRNQGVKVAIHQNEGRAVSNASNAAPAPAEEDLTAALEIAAKFLPSLAGRPPGGLSRVKKAKTCLYTMTPDEHFIIDRHPGSEDVYFAAGFSGHGFKFAPVIAEALADLAMNGTTALPIGFLRLQGRFADGRAN